jgi:hypothetical protein
MPDYPHCNGCIGKIYLIKLFFMPWWVILLIAIAIIIICSIISESIIQRRKKKRKENLIVASNAFQIRKAGQSANPAPLDDYSEKLAQQIRKLLYDSAYYQNRNVYEFDSVLKELAGINKEILINRGKQHLNLIIDRVEYLCGSERMAFAELINIMRDSYVAEIKSKEVKVKPSQNTYSEKDNHGTRQETVQMANAYWYNRNFGTGKSEPFLLYAFSLESEAKKALTEVDFIHITVDTGNLICTRICHFGYYATQAGHWEVIIAGSDFDKNDFIRIQEIFKKNNGMLINERSPEDGASIQSDPIEISPIDISQVKFKHKYQKPADATRSFTYEVFEAPNRDTAIRFLENKVVNEPLYYLLVDTPQGSFGKDNGGIYDA